MAHIGGDITSALQCGYPVQSLIFRKKNAHVILGKLKLCTIFQNLGNKKLFEQYALANFLFNLVSGTLRLSYDIDLKLELLDGTGYWLAKGHQTHNAALWKPGYYEDLYCPDEGYGGDVSQSQDGNSVNLITVRPGYMDYYFIGAKQSGTKRR